jgi:hypothetical protein
MGKSSLMYRAADVLQRESVRSVTIDLTGIGTGVTEEQWYLGHLLRIKKDLKLTIDYLAWWRANGHLGAVQRFGLFLTDVALREIGEPIAIFIDEIDTTLNLAYSDDYSQQFVRCTFRGGTIRSFGGCALYCWVLPRHPT